MITTYLFDLDDTIVDSTIYTRMYHKLIDELLNSLKISKIELQQAITKLKNETGEQKIDTFDLCKSLGATDIYYKVLERHIKHTYTLKYKEIPSIFKKIKESNKIIGIVTQSQVKTAELFLKRFRLFSYIDFIQSGKKENLVFWMNLEKKHDLKKENCLMIDDSDDVLEIAKRVGYNILNVKNLDDLSKFDY
ncbi:HAD family hydrolase [archaeon]|jgi:phosphoglycolate phosphatase-like HAD superfamily hydrolase|nr:HAD family hydrolase [archaeon]MBT4022698.1 HAD family hydrolase [archaeon]MBT4273108.1 HAD family hydrolase [archaeon]MBT4461089.1 HAD family hydrolase [archaeon]MBT4858758.1 HAD family hydrolase [archaeon]